MTATLNRKVVVRRRLPIFYSLREAQVLIEAWRRHYNTVRPHSALGYRPPAPEAVPRPWPAWIPLRLADGQAADVVYH
jgi:putative transposase